MTTVKGTGQLTGTHKIKGWLDSVVIPLETRGVDTSLPHYHTYSTQATCEVGKKSQEVQATSHLIST